MHFTVDYVNTGTALISLTITNNLLLAILELSVEKRSMHYTVDYVNTVTVTVTFIGK